MRPGVPGATGANVVPLVEREHAQSNVSVLVMANARVILMQVNPATKAHVLLGDSGAIGPHVLPAVVVDSEFVDVHATEKASVLLAMRNKKVAALWPIVKFMDSGPSGALAAERALQLIKNQLKLVRESVLFRINVVRLIWSNVEHVLMFHHVQAGLNGPSGVSVQSHARVVPVPVQDSVKMDQTVLAIKSSQKSVPKLHVHRGHHGSNGALVA